MKKDTKRIIEGITAAAAGVSVAAIISHQTAKMLVNTALDRELPKRMKRVKLSKPKREEHILKELPELSENLKNSCETVEITSHDGEKLIGHWHREENAERIIIAMHGWRSSWTNDFCAISEFWHSNNCSVLYAEQRGQNNSGGNYMGFGMIERFDCLDWINRVDEHNENNLPIYLAGVSMGASTVLMTGGFRLPENIHGIIADCGFTSADAIWKHVAENNIHVPYNANRRIIDALCRKKIQVGFKDYTTLDAMKDNKVPVLFIHGTDDDFVPIEMTYENYKACTAPKRLFVVPGAPHAASYIVDKEGYEKTFSEFWKDYD